MAAASVRYSCSDLVLWLNLGQFMPGILVGDLFFSIIFGGFVPGHFLLVSAQWFTGVLTTSSRDDLFLLIHLGR